MRGLLRVQELGVLIALLLLCGYLTISTPSFFTPFNLMGVARQASYYGILATGMVFVLVMGDVDLSVGSILTLTNIVMALLLREKYPLVVALLAALATGALCGVLNGIVSVALRIPMIIVTLGTLSLFKGLALLLCKAQPISEFSKENWFFLVGGGKLFGKLPTSVAVMLALCGVAWVGFVRTVHGRRIQAIGGNPLAARLSGLPIGRYRIAVMALSGTISALAGVVSLAFLESADAKSGEGFELWAIASAVIGGTALSGGMGSVPGAILGALIIAVINNGIVLLGFSPYAGTAVTGSVIVLAVAIDSLVKRRTAAMTRLA
jgi:ribose/xylose/arabinose/galactoside ABC-type transport system permease subunit